MMFCLSHSNSLHCSRMHRTHLRMWRRLCNTYIDGSRHILKSMNSALSIFLFPTCSKSLFEWSCCNGLRIRYFFLIIRILPLSSLMHCSYMLTLEIVHSSHGMVYGSALFACYELVQLCSARLEDGCCENCGAVRRASASSLGHSSDWQ